MFPSIPNLPFAKPSSNCFKKDRTENIVWKKTVAKFMAPQKASDTMLNLNQDRSSVTYTEKQNEFC